MANTKVTGDLIASLTIATGNIANNAITSDKISGLTTAHITEGANLYYTDARARAAVSVSGNALSYNSSTGVITSNFEESPTFTGNVTVSGTYLTLGSEGYIRSDDSGYLHFQGGTTGTRFFNNANNTALFTILNNGNATFAGNVGIGSAPAGNPGTQILSVGTPATTAGGIQLWAANNNTHYLQFGDANSGGEVYRGGIGYAHSTDSLLLLQGSATALSFTGSQAATFAGTVLIDGLSNYTGLTVKGAGASRPAILFENVNQGSLGMIYATEGDAIVINTGSDAVTIDSSGNVGIGTTSPSDRLTVSGSGNFGIRIDNSGNTSSDYSAIRLVQNTAEKGLIYTNQEDLYLRSPSGDVLLQHSGGNVGIGTTSLTNSSGYNTLSISGTTGAQIAFQTSGVGKHYIYSTATDFDIYNGQAGNLKLYTNSTERMRIDSSGNVGIGTTLPGYKLHVAGNINIQGTGGYLRWNSGDMAIVNAGSYAMAFQTYTGSALTEKMRITSAGSVGIGTTSPGSKLHITGSSSGSITNLLRIQNPVNSAGTGHGASLILHSTTDSNRGVAIASSSATNYATNNDMIFYTSSSSTLYERMRIDSNGQVGIGTASPIAKQHNVITSNGTALLLNNSLGGSGAYVDLDFNTYTVTQAGFANAAASIRVIDDGAFSGNITFRTKGASIGASQTERMRVTASGQTLIGITSEQNAGRLQIDSGTSENGGILDIAGSGWYRYYTRVCRNATTVNAAGYWHIKTNIVVNSNVMFMAKFYGYIYGSAQIVDLTHAGYAYSGTNSVINQATTNNGSEPNASSAIYLSATGNKVTFRIAFGTGSNFSTYFAGVMMDMAFPSPTGQGHDFAIEAQSFSTSTTVY